MLDAQYSVNKYFCLRSLKSMFAFTESWHTNHKYYHPLAVLEQPLVGVPVGMGVGMDVHLNLSVHKLHCPSSQFQYLCC